MSGIKILADTNILIYHFTGNDKIEKFLNKKLAITYSRSLFKPLPLNYFIDAIAVFLRKAYKIKLLDAIIAATCFFLNIPLLTFDEDFYKI